MKSATQKSPEVHRELILDQFTRQAVPFSQMPVLSNDQTNRLVIETVGFQSDDIVLDVACGPGLITCAIAQVAQHVTGIDITPAMIEQAKARQHDMTLSNMDWRIGDCLPLPFPDASFSAVITRYSFHHFLDPAAVLAEMIRVCRPGGKVAVVDMFTSSPVQAVALNEMEKLRDPSHARTLPLEELSALFKSQGIQNPRTAFYQVAMELENQLERSFPKPGDADRIREIFQRDLSANRLGMEVVRRDGIIHFTYPIVIIAGEKADVRRAGC